MTTPRPFPAIRTPRRVRHGYRQAINATPDTVFPLLCPVREMDWLAGWRPHWVLSASGVAERHCVFQTPGDDGPDAPSILVDLVDEDGTHAAAGALSINVNNVPPTASLSSAVFSDGRLLFRGSPDTEN